MSQMFSLFALVIVASVSNVYTITRPSLLVLSFEDFHPEYFDADKSPYLSSLKTESTGPTFMNTLFPPTTFATHFSMSTGVPPSVHGVYGDQMFDEQGQKISDTKNQFSYNQDIVPIWVRLVSYCFYQNILKCYLLEPC